MAFGTTLNRRHLLGGSLALAATTALPSIVAAQIPRSRPLPAQREFIIRNAHVVSMDPAIGDLARGDVHVRDGVIVAVGVGLAARGADIIDGKGMIALPGLIDTHWHMWEGAARNLAGEEAKTGYFPHSRNLGVLYTPEDNARGVRLCLAEAIHSGITTVHNWSHNILSPAYAEAELAAHKASGGRARFSYGYSRKTGSNAMLPLDDIAQFHKKFFSGPGDGRITFGIANRGLANNPVDMCVTETQFARKLGLPITTHAGIIPGKNAGVAEMQKAGLLGPDVLLIHVTNSTPEEKRILGETRTPVSCSPYTELRTGFGITPVQEFLAAKVPLGLSIDTTVLCGNADMFAVMKAMQNIADGQAQSEFAITPRRVLEMGTIDGAHALGLGDKIGSLTPGKRADLILVRTDAINMAPMAEPIHMIVQAAQPANVDTVMVDGRFLKRHGKLTTLDVAKIMSDAQETIERVDAQMKKS